MFQPGIAEINSNQATRIAAQLGSQAKVPTGLGNQNMNMAMDKPKMLNITAGTRAPQVNNAKMRFPGPGN